MRTIIITAACILGTQISLLANTPQTQKLSNPNKTKKANAGYEMSKELRKTKTTNKSASSEANPTNSINKQSVIKALVSA